MLGLQQRDCPLHGPYETDGADECAHGADGRTTYGCRLVGPLIVMPPARSARVDVRNPLTRLPAAQKIAALPLEARAALRSLMLDMATDAAERAEKCWRKSKAPMAAYWKAVSVYAKHASRLAK